LIKKLYGAQVNEKEKRSYGTQTDVVEKLWRSSNKKEKAMALK